jgi:hypothetical protein
MLFLFSEPFFCDSSEIIKSLQLLLRNYAWIARVLREVHLWKREKLSRRSPFGGSDGAADVHQNPFAGLQPQATI